MKVTVIGLGRVGAVVAAGLAAAGHDTLGVDIDRQRIAAFQDGQSPFYEPGLAERTAAGISQGRLRFQHRDEVAEPLGAAVIIAVGTPPTADGGADLSQARAALNWIKGRQPRDLVIVMKSTAPPGAGAGFVQNELKGLPVGYAANPEFLREGRALADWDAPSRIVIGVASGDEKSVAAVKGLHLGIDAPYLITDITSAEMVKYTSNAFLATRVSFINEIAALCEQVGASIDTVSEGLALDPRTGAPIQAGVGYGGSCFPKDVRALDYLASSGGRNLELLRAVISVNNRQRLLPWYALRERFNGQLAGVRVGVMGLAFKPETDDLREAPSLALIEALAAAGAKVRAFDPQVGAEAAGRLPAGVELVDSLEAAAYQAQGVALLTEWREIVEADWTAIAKSMRPPRFLFDGRNALDAARMGELGFEYRGVGRPAWYPLEQQGDGARE